MEVVEDIAQNTELQIPVGCANLLDSSRFEERHRIVATRKPPFRLPGVVARCAPGDLLDNAFRKAVRQCCFVDECCAELPVCGTVSDTPWTDRVVEIVVGVNGPNVDVSAMLVTTFASFV